MQGRGWPGRKHKVLPGHPLLPSYELDDLASAHVKTDRIDSICQLENLQEGYAYRYLSQLHLISINLVCSLKMRGSADRLIRILARPFDRRRGIRRSGPGILLQRCKFESEKLSRKAYGVREAIGMSFGVERGFRMSAYDRYIVTTPRPEHLTHYRLPLDVRRSMSFMDSSVVEGACNIECVWYYKPFEGPSHHVHDDTDEILGFFGSNHDDPESLGGLIEFRFEDEWVTLEKSCMIFLPKGLAHCPFKVLRVDYPIFHFAISPEKKFARPPRQVLDGSLQ